MDRVSNAIDKYHKKILDENEYPDESIEKISKMSIHWMKFLEENGPRDTRNMIHEFLLEQIAEKRQQANNLKRFTEKILSLLNSKYEYVKIKFEIES